MCALLFLFLLVYYFFEQRDQICQENIIWRVHNVYLGIIYKSKSEPSNMSACSGSTYIRVKTVCVSVAISTSLSSVTIEFVQAVVVFFFWFHIISYSLSPSLCLFMLMRTQNVWYNRIHEEQHAYSHKLYIRYYT